MLATLILSLTISTAPSPALRLQAPDWAFLQRAIHGDATTSTAVDAFLAKLDALRELRLPRYDSPFALDEYAEPFADMATPAEDAREALAAFALSALQCDLDGLVRP
jgi:hypothetical protein